MAPKNRILLQQRLRRPPAEGWSWIDRRFLREHADALSRDAVLLYLFLAAVSDRHGLSYYGDSTVSARLRLEKESVAEAREELLRHDLIAYQAPLYQLLSIPRSVLRSMSTSGLTNLHDHYGEIAARSTTWGDTVK